MVNDNPENMLLKEVDQIRQSQKEMKKTLEMVNQQIAVNFSTKNQLKRDFENKDRAMNLDQTAFEVTFIVSVLNFILFNQSMTINSH